MTRATIDQTAGRIAEHVKSHGIPYVAVIFHGGEPLLAGPALLDHAARTMRETLSGLATVALSVQTNGILLDEEFLELFLAHRVQVGISLDGPAHANDRHRVGHQGKGSHAAVMRGLRRLRSPRYEKLYGGLLCTVDLANDPIEVYEHLLGLAPPEIDFLLPHGTWSNPPPGRSADPTQTPYADWLATVFDHWYASPGKTIQIRLFESLISLLLGGPSGTDVVGPGGVDLITVETDGTLEQGDVLKVTRPGGPATGLHIGWDSFDDYLAHPAVLARQAGVAGLSEVCRACPVVRICGGGHYAHRYRSHNGFDNPSVYCADLASFIGHVAGRLATDLAPGAGAEPNPSGSRDPRG
ncbi:hypothetical protein GCM10009681_26360 [Luedemannella helvata]|uniref:Radical SAM core domain-containing protein n=2 Tax=Luedemannella helvata TaxID=349315 RepID=A0ABP4WJT6_9ACTN